MLFMKKVYSKNMEFNIKKKMSDLNIVFNILSKSNQIFSKIYPILDGFLAKYYENYNQLN